MLNYFEQKTDALFEHIEELIHSENVGISNYKTVKVGNTTSSSDHQMKLVLYPNSPIKKNSESDNGLIAIQDNVHKFIYSEKKLKKRFHKQNVKTSFEYSKFKFKTMCKRSYFTSTLATYFNLTSSPHTQTS